MAYWLVKSEPGAWSWDQHVAAGIAEWDGVRNHQAANNMKAMQIGDEAFFYHSGKEREIVGVLEVVKTYYADPTDASGRFGMVDFKAIKPLARPVTLADVKTDGRLGHLALVRHSRLSVMPIDADAWRILCEKGGIET
ncbi:MAG: EVE domain-containing protein [Rhodospirillales bacterium]|jgi:predicted RNA-binding protein with PUA-like domain|nr:EVE domain-containing protein [Rhodospirillales bacterium]MDP6804805.1 EVE domain-containing protein [Rhodospirillales bacterium]